MILKKINVIAYKLSLPAEARIHGTFNISMLKPVIALNEKELKESLSNTEENGPYRALPIKVLDTREMNNTKQELVQWLGGPPSMATWVDVKVNSVSTRKS